MFSVSDLKKTKVYQEALQEGREEGRKEGREEGRIEIAKEMLANGMSVELVHQMTKLPLVDVQRLVESED